MKTYRIRENVKKRYLFDGIIAIVILGIFLFVGHRTYSSPVSQVIFYIVLTGYALLHVLKFRTCRMIMKEDELEFHNGMLTVKKVPYKEIRRIEYNPEIPIRIHTKKDKNYIRILNVFSGEDTEEIFDFIRSKNKKVVIEKIDKNSKSL
jgi:hypothetical protein